MATCLASTPVKKPKLSIFTHRLNPEQTMEQPKPVVQVADESVHHLSDKAIKDYKLVRKAVEEVHQKAYADLMSRYKGSI